MSALCRSKMVEKQVGLQIAGISSRSHNLDCCSCLSELFYQHSVNPSELPGFYLFLYLSNWTSRSVSSVSYSFLSPNSIVAILARACSKSVDRICQSAPKT